MMNSEWKNVREISGLGNEIEIVICFFSVILSFLGVEIGIATAKISGRYELLPIFWIYVSYFTHALNFHNIQKKKSMTDLCGEDVKRRANKRGSLTQSVYASE